MPRTNETARNKKRQRSLERSTRSIEAANHHEKMVLANLDNLTQGNRAIPIKEYKSPEEFRRDVQDRQIRRQLNETFGGKANA
jgi:hypothetical protein